MARTPPVRSYTNPCAQHPGQRLSFGCEGLGLLTVDETARALRVHPRTIWRLIDAGTGPPTLRIARRVFIRESDLEQWLQSCTQAPVARSSSLLP